MENLNLILMRKRDENINDMKTYIQGSILPVLIDISYYMMINDKKELKCINTESVENLYDTLIAVRCLKDDNLRSIKRNLSKLLDLRQRYLEESDKFLLKVIKDTTLESLNIINDIILK